MAPPVDPYRTLGLARGASLAEVKKAYRRLAKTHHPDAAGDASLPRFLAIQAAYDAIVGGAGGPTSRGTAPRRPWDADPARADATHRAYGARARRTRRPDGAAGSPGATGSAGAAGRSGTTGGTGASGSAGTAGPGRAGWSPGTDGAGGRAGTDGAGGRAGARSHRPPRSPNKATLGSTSYDGADAEPFEPDWGGASWYGTTSGTYWTLNPKEYADPRKHGPEYQARARRAAAGAAGASDPSPPGESGGVDAGTDAPAPPTHSTSSWWEATQGTTAAANDATGGDTPPEAPETGEFAKGRAGHRADVPRATPGWAWLDGERPSPTARVVRAVLGWVPLALAIGWAGGELTGCGRASATCLPTDASIVWLAQVVSLVVLLAVPRLATIAALGAVAALVAAVPVTLVLSAPGTVEGSGESDGTSAAMVVVAAGAWLVGAGLAVARTLERRSRPVS